LRNGPVQASGNGTTHPFRHESSIADNQTIRPADGLGQKDEGAGIGLIVFGTAETITCLEVYGFDEIPARLPSLESIRRFETSQ
jgi:hypothetical protein